MIINVNERDPSDLKRAITRLQKKRKYLLASMGFSGVGFQGSKVNVQSVLPELEAMLKTDISSVYANDGDVADRSAYVYVHCDPLRNLNVQGYLKDLFLASFFKLNFQPFYVGQGNGMRCFDLLRNDSHRKVRSKILAAGKEIVVVKIAEHLTRVEALCLESKLIDILGLRCLAREGILVNLDEGEKAKERRSLYKNPKADAILRKNGFTV